MHIIKTTLLFPLIKISVIVEANNVSILNQNVPKTAYGIQNKRGWDPILFVQILLKAYTRPRSFVWLFILVLDSPAIRN